METILLIEDNKDILENLTEYLEIEGFMVLTANNGGRGLELADEFTPNLIICDVLMGDMNGHEVLKLLKGAEKTQEIPFIFSTSRSENIDRAQSLALGADDYITKPFELETLLNMAKECIKSSNARHR